jgi:hypothetical protein
MQAEQNLRRKGEKLKHIPDGILVLPGANGKRTHIDIEVQISKPSKYKVKQVMDDFSFTQSMNALRYYVNGASRAVIRAVLREIEEQPNRERPSIEIIDLKEWLPSTIYAPKERVR